MRAIAKDKRGDIFQISYALIIIFVIACLGLLFFKLEWGITGAFDEMDQVNQPENALAKDVNLTIRNLLPSFHDEFVLLMFLGVTIALIIAAAKTDFNPIIIFLFLILMVVTILNASGFVNIYQGFAESPQMTDVSSQMTFTNIIFSKYTPLIFSVLGAIVLILMYGKSGGDILR